jgi:very-short-patch-repair endonuclease
MPPAATLQLSDLCAAYRHRMTDGQFFSHSTAARMWLAPMAGYFSAREPLHVTTKAPGRAPRSRGVVGHETNDPKLHVVDRYGFPVADPASTWMQLAATSGVSLDELVIVADHLVLVPEFVDRSDPRPFVTLDELRMRVAGYSGRGARRARDTLEHVRTGSESRRETQLRLALLRAGLPEPELNQVIYSKEGTRIGRADKVYRRQKLIVEYDGQQHRTDSVQYDLDMTRTEEFIRAGWYPVKIRKEQMRMGAAEAVRRVERALRERGWTR